jgi:hypothetical protein
MDYFKLTSLNNILIMVDELLPLLAIISNMNIDVNDYIVMLGNLKELVNREIQNEMNVLVNKEIQNERIKE